MGTLQFIRRGQAVTLTNVPPDRTLLQLLREDLGHTGTKEGCAEGDCGACTVAVGEVVGGRVQIRAINACICLAHSVHGKALWTVEDLAQDPLLRPADAATAGPLHPVQQALVDTHGTQCGFCTPGFAMSLFALYQGQVCQGRAVTREQAVQDLSGNLCRCTGYRPIIDAAQALDATPRWVLDEAELLQKLEQIALDGKAPKADSTYQTPATLAELLALRAQHPQAQIVAGCTDAGLWLTKQHRQFAQVLDVTRVAEFTRIDDTGGHTAIGAAVRLTDAFAALVQRRPHLARFAQRFAALPVRNAGTLGGNVANGSPIGDSMPLLIALRAQVVLASPRGERQLPLEDLYTGYRQNVMAPDEVLARILVPHPREGEWVRAYKVSKRQDDDISAVCLVAVLWLDQGQVQDASIGAGGVAAVPARARQAEAALRGQPWNPAAAERAAQALQAEFTPLSDMRASSSYRRSVLGHLMQRLWLESQGHANVSLDTLALEVQP